MSHDHPEVVVLIFGGNDNQDLRTATGWVYISHWAEWQAEYQRRVAQIMDIVAQPGVTVFWLGLPVMADLQKIVVVNHIVKEAAARPEGHLHQPTGPALDGPDGGYAAYLPNPAAARSRSARATGCTSPVGRHGPHRRLMPPSSSRPGTSIPAHHPAPDHPPTTTKSAFWVRLAQSSRSKTRTQKAGWDGREGATEQPSGAGEAVDPVVVEGGVAAALGDELVVGAELGEAAVVDHADPVGPLRRSRGGGR